jgi:hypothetical protein
MAGYSIPRGGRLRPNNVLHVFIRDVIEKLNGRFPAPSGETGFEHGRLHSFRQFFVSQAFLGGALEGEIREWVGHADGKMVEHYVCPPVPGGLSATREEHVLVCQVNGRASGLRAEVSRLLDRE